MNELPAPTDISALMARARELPPLTDLRGQLLGLERDYERSYHQTEHSLVVALMGATGAGKSTLLNALVGQALATEGVDRPTTQNAVVYAPHDALVGALERMNARVTRYHPRIDGPWSGQVLVDTPDLNSVEREHRSIAERVLELADVAMVVMHRGSVAEATQAEFLRPFAARRALIFVLNFADELSPESIQQLKGQIRELAHREYGQSLGEVPVYAISALQAKRGRDAPGEFAQLVSALRELGSRATAEKIRRSNAVGILRQLAFIASPVTLQVAENVKAIRADLEQALSRVTGTLRDDFRARLETYSGHLANEVRKQASSRWWGPASWWMRLSLLGTGGLAAATLAARRSLPVGLAVAAVSTAADKLQQHTRARSAEQGMSSDSDPEDNVLASAARALLTSSRALAQHRGMRPEQLGLPEIPDMLEQLSAARERAWTYTQAQLIPTAVARWWRWARFILMPIVNFPLLALLAHVTYRVIRAYVYGPYLAAEYYLNALAMGVALAVIGGLLASMTMSGIVERIRRSALQQYDLFLREVWSDVTEGVGRPMSDALSAAQKLVQYGSEPSAARLDGSQSTA